MKKILFNDKFGLTQAVLEGRKTMTRRLVTMTLHRKTNNGAMVPVIPEGIFFEHDGTAFFKAGCNVYKVPKQNQPAYHIGEEVAIAQNYETCWNYYKAQWESKNDPSDWHTPDAILGDDVQSTAGWTNKMFVKAEYLPRRIRFTDIKAERLQDISDEDAMREGIRQSIVEHGNKKIVQWTYFGEKVTTWFDSPREAFAALIDRISGRGTWKSNPWVYVYAFELVK